MSHQSYWLIDPLKLKHREYKDVDL